MADAIDIPAWIALFFGLYALSAAIGELRMPGGWRRCSPISNAISACAFSAGSSASP
ncbi:hypothetical protein [Qipengyuania sp.]|uniref:hypothetical protein n=1 Tax=Qipengyuania sp. TaxID=2004515 RepID=UPI003BA85FF0